MPAFKDLTGKQFGKLTVVGPHPVRTSYKMIRWICRCECGNEKLVTTANIGNNTNSCGCIRNTQGALTRNHRLWRLWSGMVSRCTKPGARSYDNYGARGIQVCARWLHFPSFLEDMGPGFFEGSSIDRIDVNGNYEPGNCRWATPKQQGRNTRSNVNIITPWGVMTVSEAAERMNMPRDRFADRVKSGWPADKLFDPACRDPLPRGRARRFAMEHFETQKSRSR